MEEFQAIADMLTEYDWSIDLAYPSVDGCVTYFMDETDEAFIRVWPDGRWELYEYEILKVRGEGVEDLGLTLNEPE